MDDNNKKTILELWDWAKKVTNILDVSGFDSQKNELSKICYSDKDSTSLKFDIEFPSEAIHEIAAEYVDDQATSFHVSDILDGIFNQISKMDAHCLYRVIIMLKDITLYRIYIMLRDSSYGGVYYQLNMCIVLDTMKIKPENANFSALLNETSQKIKYNIETQSMSVIWAIAMLNYRTHKYDTAIEFFNRYIDIGKDENDEDIKSRIIHAKIYMGYCNEKKNNTEGFNSAIDIFNELLEELENQEGMCDFVTEIYHGLGHFYNERAIFGQSKPDDNDIILARKYMNKALSRKADYYSCFGSLYHEYGDFENAIQIFEKAAKLGPIKENKELAKEMQFYKGQTHSALGKEPDNGNVENENAENEFREFEEYCENTFNNDGIVHARIFKTRNILRNISFTDGRANIRENTRKDIQELRTKLTEFQLSEYASEEIKKEYKKTLYILNVFELLYADNTFIWHNDDLFYNLKELVELMPENSFLLDFDENSAREEAHTDSNLYRIKLGKKVWLWCVSGKELKSILNNEFKNIIIYNGERPYNCIPVTDTEKEYAHKCIKGNKKPDFVIVIPPDNKDEEFEQELNSIKLNADAESCFLLAKRSTSKYIPELESQRRSLPPFFYSDELDKIMQFAFCMRTLEVIKKELLRPIPLFSLAPTHFSAPYDFQLGENVDIQMELISTTKVNDEKQKQLRYFLNDLDEKYRSKWLGRERVEDIMQSLRNDDLCCIKDGFLAVCFPKPEEDVLKNDDYISYIIYDKAKLNQEMVLFGVEENKVYSTKALPSYSEFYKIIRNMIKLSGQICDHKIIHKRCACQICCETDLSSNEDISSCCRSILSVIFCDDLNQFKSPYKCFLRTITDKGRKNEFIYMVVGDNTNTKKEKNDNGHTEEKENPMKRTTVFVTYAWEQTGEKIKKYASEVKDFVNILNSNGFDATFDLAELNNTDNWNDIMINGLKRDKIIVLLSEEFKRKADNEEKEKGSGVRIERNSLINKNNEDPKSVILAKLPSLQNIKKKDVLPECFKGKNVIDLSSNDFHDGFNLLYSRLTDIPIAETDPPKGDVPPINKI